MTTAILDRSIAPWSTQDELFRAIGAISRSAGEGSESLLGELASFLRSSPTSAQIERARRVLQAVTLSDIPFITSHDLHRENLNFALHNVLDTILDLSTIREVITLGQLSHHLRLQVRSYLVRSINIMLKQWFSDTVSFRAMMKSSGCVISGSTVLSFINREEMGSSDLDIYVSNGSSCDEVIQHLVSREGYVLRNTPRPEEDDGEHQHSTNPNTFGHHIERIHTLTKSSNTVDVIECKVTSSTLDPIFCSHATFAMNWISHDSLVVLYPNLTFEKKGLFHHICNRALNNKYESFKNRYEKRGYEVKRSAGDYGIKCGPSCPMLLRTTKDVGSMVISLVDCPLALEDVPEVRWKIGGAMGGYPQCFNSLCPRSLTGFAMRSRFL